MSEHGDIPVEPTGPSAKRGRSRRRFWGDLLGEIVAIGDEFRGIAQQSLSNIGGLPDSVLEEMVPVWMQGILLDIREDGIYRAGPDDEAICKHLFNPYEKMMVDQYACGRNLKTIADHVSQASGMAQEPAFEATKTLFIQLCQRGWCHPAASHEPVRGKRP
jgi:hypothetical protein